MALGYCIQCEIEWTGVVVRARGSGVPNIDRRISRTTRYDFDRLT